ncbi:MAG: 2-oxoacid:acceptor oxidoreductase subunit alpha [Nitrospirae bacterium]|nr:2-oxoacid:acceptor oxidoreductase subunit alpha [Nitrospirota bacterium]
MPNIQSTGILSSGTYFLQGNEACAEGAIRAGCRFYAGYPISPSSEIMERIANRFPECSGKFIQMEDEIASISAVIGASWAGAKAMTATSGPGLSLMLENIGYAIMTETPCVIVDVQRAGPSTGQATKPAQGDVMQIRWGASGDYQIIALSPWSVQEMYDLTIEAFNLSEQFRVPVFLLCDEAVGHLREKCIIKDGVEIINRKKAKGKPPFGEDGDNLVPPMPSFGEGEKLLVTGSTHNEWGFRKTADPLVQQRLVKRLSDKILLNQEKIIKTEGHFLDDAEIGIIAYGITARASLKAVKILREKGIKAGLLRLKTLWPFPEKNVGELSARVKKLIVPEMNLGQIVREVERVAECEVIKISKVNGEVMTPTEIVKELQTHIRS